MAALAIRSQLIPLAIDHLRRKNFAPPSLDGISLSGDGALTSLERLHTFLDECASISGDPWLGLHLAIDRPVGSHGLLEFFWRSSTNVRDALIALSSFSGLVNDVTRIDLVEGKKHSSVRQRVLGHCDAMGRHGNEFFCAVVVNQMHALVDDRFEPLSAWFAHAPPDRDLEPLARVLRTTNFHFSQDRTGLDLASTWLDAPLKTRDPALLQTLRSHAEAWIPQVVATASTSFVSRARAWLNARTDIPSMAECARALRVSERTLQRRLDAEATSFHELSDEVRMARSLTLLETKESVKEVSLALGFSTTQAFVRAFRRWKQMTPSEWRARPGDVASPRKRLAPK